MSRAAVQLTIVWHCLARAKSCSFPSLARGGGESTAPLSPSDNLRGMLAEASTHEPVGERDEYADHTADHGAVEPDEL